MAGGSGGHIFPAVRLSEEILKRGEGEVLFVISSRKTDRDILSKTGFKFDVIPISPLQQGNILRKVSFFIKLIAGSLKSFFIILRYRPSVVVGFGGYVSGPAVLIACILRIRTLIHEQNVYPGKTNKILAPFVGTIAVSFEKTREYFKKYGSKVILSGNPVRTGLRETMRDGSDFTVLTMGGSQGAGFINDMIPRALKEIDEETKNRLTVIHISGEKDKNKVEESYSEKKLNSRVLSFCLEIEKLFNESDFVISRAGATTVSELLSSRKPAILIPYPHAGFHQGYNAGLLESIGGAVSMEEGKITPGGLRDAIVKFMDRDFLRKMSENIKNYGIQDSCGILIREIIK